MTKKQAVEAFERGEPVLLLEYRSSRAETIRWRDEHTRTVLTAPMLTHTVENEKQAMFVAEQIDEKSFDPLAYKSPFQKGQKFVVFVSSMQVAKGVTSIRGRLEAVTG